jgi:hypothetical protein
MLAHYVYYVYKYILYIHIYIVLCFIINYEKIAHNYFKNGYKIKVLGIVQVLDLEEMRTQQRKE